MTDNLNVNEERANARLIFMHHLATIAQASATLDQDTITSKGTTISQRSEWLKSLTDDLDAIGIGFDWIARDTSEYNHPSRHNSPISFLDTMTSNPTKSKYILEILSQYLHPTSGFMRNGNGEIYDSYLLKHLLEDVLSLKYHYSNPTLGHINNNYVTNGDAKGAMMLLGYTTSIDCLKNINWSFNTTVSDWDHLQNDINLLKIEQQ